MVPPRHLNRMGSLSSSPPMRNFGPEDPPMTKEEYMQLMRKFWDTRCPRIRDESCYWYASMHALQSMQNKRRQDQAEIERKQMEMDHALLELAELIMLEATNEERARIPQLPWRYHAALFLKWAVDEGKSEEPIQRQRWSCVRDVSSGSSN